MNFESIQFIHLECPATDEAIAGDGQAGDENSLTLSYFDTVLIFYFGVKL